MSPRSHSSSDSIFDQPGSRSTSPSSIGSNVSTEEWVKSDLYLPTSYVCIPSAFFEPDVVKTVFNKYAEDHCLGVCLSCVEHPPRIPDSVWRKESVELRGRPAIADVFITPSAALDQDDLDMCSPIGSTNPPISKHLLVFSLAALRVVASFRMKEYNLYVVEQPPFVFLPLSHTPTFNVTSITSKGNIPSLEEWKTTWSAWDLITLHMIPQEMLHQKPIDLRHKCLFYIGHIPTFLDMLLSKAIGGGASEPKYFWNIFERGIDPHVDDPDHCHNHSEVPEADNDWPTLETIIEFRNRVRARLIQLYQDLQTGKRPLTRNIARTLVTTLEHEGFHIETLLYMLIQRAGSGTLPPPGFIAPPWELLAQQWNNNPAPSSPTVSLGPATVSLGHADSEGDDNLDGLNENIDGHVFGWDNESPERRFKVEAFRVDWRPVSNLEYEAFWRENGSHQSGIPASWIEQDGTIKIRTMYGPVSMDIAQHWPVLTSYDQLSAYARSKGGRLPTEPELRLFLDTYDVGYEGGANTGFRNWHPIPATMGTQDNAGKGSNGGVWEWTSTPFDTHEGLFPTNLFTGYSTDFFDGKHQVVLGASYATIPRLASRRTVRNFYQHNYPYAWVGGRVVYDI